MLDPGLLMLTSLFSGPMKDDRSTGVGDVVRSASLRGAADEAGDSAVVGLTVRRQADFKVVYRTAAQRSVVRLHLRQLSSSVLRPPVPIRRNRTCPRRADVPGDMRCQVLSAPSHPGVIYRGPPAEDAAHRLTEHISQLKRYRVMGARKTGPLA